MSKKSYEQLEQENQKLRAALKVYAASDEWSSEARFEYETGRYLATGDVEHETGSVELDGDTVWCGYGDHGYELAQKVLKELGGK